MKSFFTNLGKLLLCGATVAMIGCTDLSDITLVGDQANANKEQIADLQSTLDQLEATLQKDYALQSELEAVQKELADEKAALEAAIAAGDEAAIAAAREELTAAVAAAKAEVEAAMGQFNDQFGQINGALGQVNTDLEGVYARLEALEAAEVPEEIAAQLAALDAYVLAMEEAIIGRLDTVEQALSAVTVLIEDEAAARQLADDELWTSIYGLQEVLSAVNNKIEDIEAQEYVSAADLEAVYTSIYEAQASISSVYNQLLDLAAKHDQDVEEIYAKINVVEEALSALVFTVSDVQDELAAQLAAFEAYKLSVEEAIAFAKEEMQEYLTQMLNLTNDQIAEIVSLQEALVGRIDTIEKTITNLINLNNDQYDEVLSLIIETKEELTLVVNNILNYLSDMQGQIDDLAARVQSLVFIPEYTDGKATIEWGLLIDNDSLLGILDGKVITWENYNVIKENLMPFYNDFKALLIRELEGLYGAALKDVEIAKLLTLVDQFGSVGSTLDSAFAGLVDGINTLIKAYIDQSLGEDADPEVVKAEIMDSLSSILKFGSFSSEDIKPIIKSVLKTVYNYCKAKGVDTVYDLLEGLKNGTIDVTSIVDSLHLNEIREIVYHIYSLAKELEPLFLEKTALLKKESVIRYKVMGQNATALAAAIAANPSVLSYDVEAVDVRAAAPGLEITKVVAKGDEIHVSVVPQNFHYRFYLTYILEDSFLYGAAESFFDKMDKTGLISYSAALVLNDGKNIRSTEYTNFVSAENPEIFTPEVIKNGAVEEHETITAVKGQVDEITLCEGMYMGYLSVPNRVILTKEQLEAKGYLGFTETKTVNTNDKGIAGPCQFNGLTGTVKSWFDYTFTTYWAVNDIVLAVNSDLVWELPESVLVWEGKQDDHLSISLAAEDIAPWFDGLAEGQTLRIEYTAFEGAVCFHVYDGDITYKILEQNYKLQGQSAKQYVEIPVTADLLNILTEESILIGGSSIEVTNVTLYL